MRFLRLPIIGHLIAAIALMISVSAARAESHIGWVGDLPVPANALIETNSAVNFDSPSGRVIQFTFMSDMTAEEVTDFYRMALAELGWQAGGGGFVRGDELMMITPLRGKSGASGKAYFLEVKPRD